MDVCAVCEGPGGVFAAGVCSGCERAVCSHHLAVWAWIDERRAVYAVFPGTHAGTLVSMAAPASDPESLQEHEAYRQAWVAGRTSCLTCRDADGTSAASDVRRLRHATWAEMRAYVTNGAVPDRDPDAALDAKARLERLVTEFRTAMTGAGSPGAHAGEWVLALGLDRVLRVRTGGTYKVSVTSPGVDVAQPPRAFDVFPAHEGMTRLLLSHGVALPS
ncbi:MAG TPA: hypothetical protein VGX28_02425 [Frankiaceae bacterium]|jgi:hypothetical protein|nr:hypothetical protein [Frankiaceae bacterium]